MTKLLLTSITLNRQLPIVVRKARSLGEELDRLKETGRYEEGWSAGGATYHLYIEVMSLQERLGNYDPQGGISDFDPYGAEFEVFHQDLISSYND